VRDPALGAGLSRCQCEIFQPATRHNTLNVEVAKGLDCLRELAERGAIWKPDNPRALNSLRRTLIGCDPVVTIELLQLMIKYSACPVDRARELLRAPRMKDHLASHSWQLCRLGLKMEDKRAANQQPPPAALLAQYNRVELYERVWSQPTRVVAKLYGVSDVWLAKVCKTLRVPVPGRGYWAKKAAGRPTRKRPQLPLLKN
jgi:hypothetical protein